MRRLARRAATIAVLLASAAGLAADGQHVSLVPWQLVEAGEAVDSALVLYWIPGSPEELRRSELLTSRELTLFSSRCVAMRVIRLDDGSRLEKLGVDGELPAVVLADRAFQVVGRVEGEGGAVSVAEVEELVREELERRAAEAEALLDRARERAEEHDTAAAITIYESVWEGRCLCPRQGRDAKRALKKLARK
jgi:hypothetical protein